MPETRTFDQEPGNEIQRRVREALGETIRPTQPGAAKQEKDDAPGSPAAGPFSQSIFGQWTPTPRS